MLSIADLHVHYGGIHALKGVSLEVPSNKIITLIGTNGAGKSTTLRAVCGLVRPSAGAINFQGQDITRASTTGIVQMGITMVPEGRRVFPDLTVLENLYMGAHTRNDPGVKRDMDWVFSLFPRLKERKAQLAGTLSGGEQQMLAVGRALMANPTLLMMDEPSLGLAPMLVQEIFNIIKQIHSEGKTVLLIEQNARAALQLADYGYVLETGRIVLSGTGKELLARDEVRKAYLGEE
ncbi:MAG: ABC transporter ATP-binding protein [Bacillota bacterium]|jgi:branched-chain amino acid transport system ATP-binding protein